MKFSIGFKTDPIEYRYSFEWLFSLMREYGVQLLQYGSSVETYSVRDEYFKELRNTAEQYGIRFWSCFTAHRELGGFFTGNRYLKEAAEENHRRLIEAAGLLGAEYAGSNPGSVYRDRPQEKNKGLRRYFDHMKSMSVYAKGKGLKGLTIEPMSCLSEPPSVPGEITTMMDELAQWQQDHQENAVPFYLCGDVSHGVADVNRRVVHGNMDLFRMEIPYMTEFHIKNTDPIFSSTFGFSREEKDRGIVDLDQIMGMVTDNRNRFPVDRLVGHLELSGPKLGRDYSDHLLEQIVRTSLEAIIDAVSRYVDESGEFREQPL